MRQDLGRDGRSCRQPGLLDVRPPTSGDELENPISTQLDEDLNVDSQGTTVDGNDSQQQPSPGSSSGSESAEDKTRFRSR